MKKMNKLHTILLILVVALIALRYLRQNEGFSNEVTKSIIICKADWCGHCKAAKGDFDRLVAASPISLPNGGTADVVVLDADKDKDKMAQYKVKGFPTILLKDNASQNTTEYPGKRTYEDIIEYMGQI
jgi:thiol-disulfide isomerase/thioredoxin